MVLVKVLFVGYYVMFLLRRIFNVRVVWVKSLHILAFLVYGFFVGFGVLSGLLILVVGLLSILLRGG